MLEDHDLHAFRLVSREVNKKTFNTFGDVSFGTVRTDFTPPSIQRLQRLSAQNQIIPHIETLLVKDTRGALGHDSLSNWSSTTSALAAPPSPTYTKLCQILSRFKSCRSFRIEDNCPGSYLASFEPRRCNSSDAIAMVLAAIAQSGLRTKSFSIELSPRGEGKLDMSRLDATLYKKHEFRYAWTHLQQLSLVFTIEFDAFDWIRNLITHATNLKTLRLGLDDQESETFFTHLAKEGGLPKIEKLELQSSKISKETLLTLLQHFHLSLRYLTLNEIHLESGIWSAALLEMRHAVSRVQKFSASSLTDSGGLVLFPTLLHHNEVLGTETRVLELVDEETESAGAAIRYGGEHITSALEVLAKSAGYHDRTSSTGSGRSVFSSSGKMASMHLEQQYVVVRDFNGRNPNELVVKKNDRVVLVREEPHGKLLLVKTCFIAYFQY